MTALKENTKRMLKPAFTIGLNCLLVLVVTEFSMAQVPTSSQEELVKIAVKNKYCLTLRFNNYPDNAFNLWLPELAIFDSDMDRSKDPHPIEGVWLSKREGNLQVSGQLTTDIKSMDFKCTINPLSSSIIMLELEVSNTGQADWTDYTQLAICLAPAENNPAFSDTNGERSYISHQNDDIQSITQAGVVGDYNHYAVSLRNDPADTIQRARVNDGFVARKSADNNISVSFMWEESARVDVNPGGLDCFHSHPAVGPLKTGDSKSLKGFIMIEEGSALDHHGLMKDLLDTYAPE